MEEVQEYKPVIDLSKVTPGNWIDYKYGYIQNALHKYYCTGDQRVFANQKVYDFHYDILKYKFSQKEEDYNAVVEMTVKLITRLFQNILERNFKINPVAYRTYIDQSCRYVLIDHIRAKRKKPPELLYADPQLAVYDPQSIESVDTYEKCYSRAEEFTPEDSIHIKDIDLQLVKVIKRTLDMIFTWHGSSQFLYFIYHFYLNRNKNIFSGIPEYYMKRIETALRMIEYVIPQKEYLRIKNRKEESNG